MLRAVASIALGLAAAGTQAQADPVSSRQEILYEIATTHRLLADEQFLNRSDEAAASYRAAASAAAQLRPELGLVDEGDILLLQREIEYRQALLESGASFWGIEHTTRPINPVGAMQRLNDTFARFESQVTEIDGLVARLEDAIVGQTAGEVAVLQAGEQGAVASLERQVAETQLRYAVVRRAMIEQRMAAIASRQMVIAAERGPLLDQLDAAAAQMNATLTNAAAAYIGLPPNATELVDGVAQGDVSAALSAAVAAYDASGAATLDGPLAELVASSREVADQYREIKETVDSVEAVADRSAELLRAVQSGNTRRILAAGEGLYDQLPAATQEALQEGVLEDRTVQSVVVLAREGTELRDAVATYIQSAPQLSALIVPALDEYLDLAQTEFDERYALALRAAVEAATTVAEKEQALRALSRAWAGTVVDDLLGSPENLERVATALGETCSGHVSCRERLLERIGAQGLSGEMVRVDRSGEVRITHPTSGVVLASFSISALAERAVQRPLDTEKALLRADVDRLRARLAAAESEISRRLIAALPDGDFDTLVGPILTDLDPTTAAITVNGVSPVSADGVDLLSNNLASYALGNSLNALTVGRPRPLTGATPSPAGGSSEDALMLQALAATGPYGAAAAVAIKVLSGMEAMSDIAEQAARLDREDQDLTVELLHLAPLKVDLDRDEALAGLAGQIATTRVAGAGRRGQTLQSALARSGTQTTAMGTKIKNRLPLTYYLSELLREQYDELDQALGSWTGGVGTGEGRLESSLRGDPNARRLALDPDIDLYGWFDRSAEGQRTDLDRLLQHWRQLTTLASQSCSALGCSDAAAQLGWVETTERVDLDQLAAKIGPPGTARRIRFTLLPHMLPDLPEREGLRLVAVAGHSRHRSTGAPSNPVTVRIRHSGLGFILRNGEGLRETLDASEEAALEYRPGETDLAALRTSLQARWSAGQALAPLEGYPLFGLYEVLLPPSFNPSTHALALTFVYQRPKTSLSAPADYDGSFLSCAGMNSAGRIDAAEIQLLLQRDPSGLVRGTDGVAPDCRLVEEMGQ